MSEFEEGAGSRLGRRDLEYSQNFVGTKLYKYVGSNGNRDTATNP